MKLNLSNLCKVHAFVASMLLFLTITACIQTTIMVGPDMSTKYAWLPSIPFMISSLIIVILALYRRYMAFIIGLIQVIFTLQTFETFLQIPTWEISFDIYLFATFRFVAELTAIFNLILLVTSSAGIYLMIKRYIDKRER